MPIKLPEPIQNKCMSLIDIATMLNIFSIDLFVRVMNVSHKIKTNTLLLHDLQDIQLLCKEIVNNERINTLLKDDINQLDNILDLFITVSYSPIRACGMWSSQID